MAKQTYTTGQVLTAAQMTTLQANDYNWTVSAKTANYVLVAADAGTRITMTNASATTITVNTGVFTAGDTLEVINLGAGTLTITAGTATVDTAGSLALSQYESGILFFNSTSAAVFFDYTQTAGAAAAGTLTGTTLASNVVISSLTSFGASPVIASPKISSTYTAKTAAYTFASGDEGNIFSMNAATSQQFNIPTDATFNFAIGTEINVFWITGAGQPTIGAVTPGTTTVISTGATSATPKLRVANSGATCKKLAANSWIVFGDIS
jgi:hypothetical protein